MQVSASKEKDFVFLRSDKACPKFVEYGSTERVKHYKEYNQFLTKAGTFKRVSEVFSEDMAAIIDKNMGYESETHPWRLENILPLFSNLWSYRYLHGKDFQPDGTGKELSIELMDELKTIFDGVYHFKRCGDK